MSEKYNGWTNYETWLVNLWLDNGGSGEHWREEAERWLEDNREDKDAETLRAEGATFIAEGIESEHADALAEIIPGASGVFQDLLSASLRQVNWREIAEHYVDDVPLFSAGWNMPGYMPDSDPALFTSHSDAIDYIRDEIERARDEAEESHNAEHEGDDHATAFTGGEDAEAAAARLEQVKDGEDTQEQVGQYVYWVAKV